MLKKNVNFLQMFISLISTSLINYHDEAMSQGEVINFCH